MTFLLPLAGFVLTGLGCYLLGLRHGYDDGVSHAYDEVERYYRERS